MQTGALSFIKSHCTGLVTQKSNALQQPDTVRSSTRDLEVAAGKLPTLSTPASAPTYLETSHRAVAGTATIHFNDPLQTVAETYANWATTEATLNMQVGNL